MLERTSRPWLASPGVLTPGSVEANRAQDIAAEHLQGLRGYLPPAPLKRVDVCAWVFVRGGLRGYLPPAPLKLVIGRAQGSGYASLRGYLPPAPLKRVAVTWTRAM